MSSGLGIMLGILVSCTVTASTVCAQSTPTDSPHKVGSRIEARILAERYLNTSGRGPDVAINDSATVETPWGWVFNWNSREALETGDFKKYGIPGNGPLIVDRCGRVTQATSAQPPAKSIEEYGKNFKDCG